MAKLNKVYFVAVDESDQLQLVKEKLSRLLKESRLLDCLRPKDKVALKLHFGEEKNTGYVRPQYLRVICKAIAGKGARSFLCDTNALYRGGRTNSSDHLKLAYEHGFTPDIVGVPVVIPDDTKRENSAEVVINQRLIKVAKVAKLFLEADVIMGVAHFKGHMMTGFGGALKNIAMGCATREGKMAQHCDVAPLVTTETCVGCRVCVEVCPVKAITVLKQKARIDKTKCIGCASCIAACDYGAIDVDWVNGEETIQDKMAEYALAVLKGKQARQLFLNFALKITKQCDCLAEDDPRIAPDLGILAATDPVSIDQASVDLVSQACGRDIFREAHPGVNGARHLTYASKLGLGSLDYELIEI